MKQIITKEDLENNAKRYDLLGVEFTDEDVELANRLLNNGKDFDGAIHQVLSGIAETLSV